MAVSSNFLIHFTKKKSVFENILKNGFKLHYCKEKIKVRTGEMEILVPMVSFCDLPLSQIMNHVDSYGAYGIGLNKEWAERNGLNPILYIEKESNFGHSFFPNFLQKFKTDKKISDMDISEKSLYDIFRYMKNYQGELKRKNKVEIKNYRFSDEREWRYVLPSNSPHKFLLNCSSINDTIVATKKLELNKLIENIKLNFTPSDIKYLILKNEDQRVSFLNKLPQIFPAISQNEKNNLVSRVITIDQLKTDF